MKSEEEKTYPATVEIYQAIINYVLQQSDTKVLMKHFGFFSQELINSLADSTEELMIANNEKRDMIRRVFSIFIEGLQNIRKHGKNDKDGIQKGLLVFYKKGETFRLVIGNIIDTHLIDKMKSRLDELNTLSQEEVLERYKSVLGRSILSNSGGAGLGFVTIKMKSRAVLNYQFEPISPEHSLFSLYFEIKKSV